jgi:serine/threonine protein kinase
VTEVFSLIKCQIRPELVTFDKEKRLGSGTYATVYDGMYLGTEVAIKRFKIAESASLKAYHKELEVFTWLRVNGSHPNLIHMLGTYTTPKYAFIVLEKAVHSNVSNYLKKNRGHISIYVKLRWALQIAQAMAFLHNHNQNEQILHRDIKAENILITSSGELACSTVKICDFGYFQCSNHTIGSLKS